jgi:exopolysaccharide biosynthesis polyprenyl glycosylphosphotransferase
LNQAVAHGAAPTRAPRLRLNAELTIWAMRALDAVGIAVFAGCAAELGYGTPLGALTIADAAPILLAVAALHLGSLSAKDRSAVATTPLALGLAGALIALAAHGAPAIAPALAAGATVFMALSRLGLESLVAMGASVDRETAVIVGATDAARRFIARNAEAGAKRLDIVAVFDDRLGRVPKSLDGVPVFGDVEALLTWDALPQVDQVVLAVSPSAEMRVRALIERLRIAPNRIVLLLDLERLSPEPTRVSVLADTAVAQVAGAPRDRAQAAAKRAMDMLIAVALLVVLAPLLFCIAAAVRLDSPGPALFRQRRLGVNDRPFTVLKFRTMRPTVERDHPIRQVQANDSRVTRLGAFLRRTSLDELPQLWNVLKGDMSLVGPRPHPEPLFIGETPCKDIEPRYRHRNRVKPGLTGWAQINGSRGPLETARDVRDRIKLDLDYIERAHPLLDLWIMLRTAPALLGDKLRVR